MPSKEKITRANVTGILRQFAKEYRKALGKAPGEIVIVGGGSIMLNYRFRDSTQDLDVILRTASGVRDVIARFADENNLPNDWMNTDFMKTASYSTALSEVSRHYCWLNNQTLEIRTVSGVYLIAMKMVSHRYYRNDISDAIGIMIEEAEKGNGITYEEIEKAYRRLYHAEPDDETQQQFRYFCTLTTDGLRAVFDRQKEMEVIVGKQLLTYTESGMNVTVKNVKEVAEAIRKKKEESKQQN